MKFSIAPRQNRTRIACMLGVVVTALYVIGTLSTTSARLSASTPKGTIQPLAAATFMPPPGSGTGVVNLTAVGGSCLALTPAQAGGPDVWEVVEGGTYSMTISGVTECTGDFITVFAQGGITGNFCFNLAKTAAGTYTGTFTMPNPACFTYPLSYKCGANQPCNNSNSFRARGPAGSDSVHLRASTFSAGCTNPVEDTNCDGTQLQGCLIEVPPGDDLGCNPLPNDIPECNIQSVIITGCIQPGSLTCTFEDTADGCMRTRTFTYSAIGCDQVTCSQTQTFTWKVDTEAPVLHNVPPGGSLGCNPTPPTCDSTVTATDNCDTTVTVNCTPGTIQSNGCARTQTFTYSASDSCNNPVSQTVTYTWTEDTTPPVLPTLPTGGNLGCNPTPPSCVTGLSATDNCDGTVPVICTPGTIAVSGCTRTQSFTYSATDSCGNPASQTVTYTWTEDTTPPTFTNCPTNRTVPADAGVCCATVNFNATATDNCGTPTVVCVPPSGTCFPVGTTTVSCVATDGCGNTNGCNFSVTVLGQICAVKFYDANTNGVRDVDSSGNFTEPAIAGWKVVLDGTTTGYTGQDGKVCFNVAAGEHTLTEVFPNGNWVSTTGTSCTKTISAESCRATCSFGNVCLGAGGGLTLGFWSNKNGKAILQANDPAWRNLLNSLHLKDANGNDFDISLAASFTNAYDAFRTWILNATAVNMSYMLSAQMAAMKLNATYGSVSGSSLVFAGANPAGCTVPVNAAGFISINALIADADAELAADGYTPDGDPQRVCQEFKKNALDKGNNNLNFVQARPCPFTTPY